MHTKPDYKVGQVIAWPTLSANCVLADFIDSNAARATLSPTAAPEELPRFHAVIFEVLPNGEALAAYNARHTAQELADGRCLPVFWLRYR